MQRLNWTGDPYLDIGLATILAFCNKGDPSQLSEDDLQHVADWIAQNYTQDPLKSFLTVAFTSNAWFAQPSFTPEKRAARGRLHLFAWQQPAQNDERCVFTGLPVAASALSDKLMPGRAARAQIPLTQGDEDINFYPNGDPGLPISGEALLCLQAFPLGCAKLSGRLLAVHASQPAITLAFAREFLAINRTNILIAQQAGETKLADTRYGVGTLLVETLTKIIVESRYLADDRSPLSVTAYHLTNGQAPEVSIYHLPLGVTGFLRLANTPRYSATWQHIVQTWWPREAVEETSTSPNRRRSTKTKSTTGKPTIRRNPLYEDLLRLPEGAPRFLRVYLLSGLLRQAKSLITPALDATRPADLALWELIELFLKEVMSMDKTRIEHIRALGDRLADYVEKENDRRFFRAFYSEQNYNALRNALLRANTAAVRRQARPLVTFDQFIEVFEEGEDVPYKDWKLARDLVLIRMIERLTSWLAQNAEAVPEIPADDQEATDE